MLRTWIRAVVAREVRNIDVDPYANAFRANYRIWERKWEVDSLAYPLLLAWTYEAENDDRRVFYTRFHRVLARIVTTYDCESRHASCSAIASLRARETDAGRLRISALFGRPFARRTMRNEVDGLGGRAFFDDANIASLLAAPLVSNLSIDEPLYALTSADRREVANQMFGLAASAGSDGLIHESFDPNDPRRFTRAEFGWANAMYAELRFRTAADFAAQPIEPATAGIFRRKLPESIALVDRATALRNTGILLRAFERAVPLSVVGPEADD